MPFQQMSKNQQRQKLAYRVLCEHLSVAQAAREMGVSRQSAHLWVARAKEVGVQNLAEASRRPRHIARQTPEQIEAAVLEKKGAHPAWGAKKIHALLWPPGPQSSAPVCVRTVDRLLSRHGLTGKRCVPPPGRGRFEREGCNQLWQLDYKGMGAAWHVWPLSVLDDHSRFCLGLVPVQAKTGQAAWEVLWQLFGEFGLPDCLLCDNGDGFNNTRSLGPTWLQARLWRLGIATTHGRARHPQTQGKVERFHKTLEVELGQAGLRQESVAAAGQSFERFRASYNWVRPHEALGQRVPGALYTPSPRPRPAHLPVPQIAPGATVRKVDSCGKFSYRNRAYRAGRGLAGEWVEVREEETEEEAGEALFYAGVRLAALERLRL